MSKNQTEERPGYLPNGGGADATYGRAPCGTAYTKSGTLRKKRRTLTPLEKFQQEQEATKMRLRSYARDIFAMVASVAALLKNASIVRAWDREAVSYDSQEKVDAKATKARAYIDSLQARHEAATAYLDNRADLSALATFEEKVGEDVAEFIGQHGRVPDADEAEALCLAHISEEMRETLSAAADPENDPFAAFRRDAVADADADDNEEDTL